MRTILHADLNNFYASVECLYHPEYKNIPLAVAGDPTSRQGIILAKNLVAKKLGVQTGEAIWQARLKAPGLVTVPPHFDLYLHYSHKVKALYAEYTDKIESFGIDEAWLDITHSPYYHGDGTAFATMLRNRVQEEIGLTISVGVSFNKIFAKLGSDMKKPDATTTISYQDYPSIVFPLPVGDLLYVGRATQKKLEPWGIRTIGDLAHTSPEQLVRLLGKMGHTLWLFANGRDDSPVRAWSDAPPIKSIGNGTTCHRDLCTRQDVLLVFTVLVQSVTSRLRHYELKARAVQIQVKDKKFTVYNRQRSLDRASFLASDLLSAAMSLYDQDTLLHQPLRSLSIRAINLTSVNTQEEQSLFEEIEDTQIGKEKLAHTIDQLRERFGMQAIVPASYLLDKKLTNFNPQEEHIIHPQSFFR